jgi:hypothetical protein
MNSTGRELWRGTQIDVQYRAAITGGRIDWGCVSTADQTRKGNNTEICQSVNRGRLDYDKHKNTCDSRWCRGRAGVDRRRSIVGSAARIGI